MLITCRAVGRAFRFVPTRKVVETLWFVFAYALSQYKVDVHEFCWMSNHYHIVLTTRDAKLPKMIQKLNSLSSRALNALRGRRGCNIERGYNIVVETNTEAIIRHCAYTAANPAAGDLVVRAIQWKGVTSIGMRYGETIVLQRPRFGLWGTRRRHAMRSTGRSSYVGRTCTPETVKLTLVRPPVWLELSDTELRKEVLRRVAVREANAEELRRANGRRVLGMKRSRRQHWNSIPESSDGMFGPVPKAAGNRWAVAETLRRSTAFVRQYREALGRWIAGDRNVEFPSGTYLMRQRYAVRCASP